MPRYIDRGKPYTDYVVKLGDLEKAIQDNPYDPAMDIKGYMRYLKYNTAEEGNSVDIVRCKDCKWWDQKDDSPYGYCHAMKHAYYSSHWEIGIYRTYKADWFCADGERKDDVNDAT